MASKHPAPGPEPTYHDTDTTTDADNKRSIKSAINAKYGRVAVVDRKILLPQPQPTPKWHGAKKGFMTKGNYFAMGFFACASVASTFFQRLDMAIWFYAIGGILFILFCQPVVNIVVRKLDQLMIKHHEEVASAHGPWLKEFCPTCHALYTEAKQ